MPELPLSARTALWVTAAWSGHDGAPGHLDRVLRRAMPDLDHLGSGAQTLQAWGELGERALLYAACAPGDPTRLPPCGADVAGAAAEAGECVYVPSLGGLLVPTLEPYGPEGDEGWRVDWAAFAADPVPRHRVEMLDARAVERHLREVLSETVVALESVGGRPFASRAAADLADARLGADWALPEGIGPRTLGAIQLAATLSTLAHAGLDGPDDALDATASSRRRALLLRLEREAEQGLSDAVNAAVVALAGWVPAR